MQQSFKLRARVSTFAETSVGKSGPSRGSQFKRILALRDAFLRFWPYATCSERRGKVQKIPRRRQACLRRAVGTPFSRGRPYGPARKRWSNLSAKTRMN